LAGEPHDPAGSTGGVYGFKTLFLCASLIFFFSCASTFVPPSEGVLIPEDFFGLVHAGRTGKAEEYRLLDEMGVKWILNTFYWSGIESERGIFDFSGSDAYVDHAKKEGRKIIAVLGYAAPWLFPKGKDRRYISPENIPFFLSFVEETVRRYRGRVDVWEIWNEPNFMFWDGPDNEFFELSRLAARKIRETDPGAHILGGVFWRTPEAFIKAMYKAGAMEDLDGLAFHPYALNPQGAMKLYDRFTGVLAEIGYTRPVWITEMGYPTGGWFPSSVSREEFPAYVVKTLAGAAARGARVLLWYELFDAHNEGRSAVWNSEKNFGLVYPDYRRKAGSYAYELCARFLPGALYLPDLPRREGLPSSINSFYFRGKSGHTLILWNDRESVQTANLFLPSSGLLYDISTGESRPIGAETVLALGNMPLIVTWEDPDLIEPRLSPSR
jgi:hypothetical protein